MRILSKADVFKPAIIKEIKRGAVFIYPTDTIYGIGCVADNESSARRIREIKGRDAKPFSIIAPSLGWITENCVMTNAAKKWLLKLPGSYTLVLPLKHHCVAVSVNSGLNTLGIRIPNHWISSLVQRLGIPVITTSVNMSGQPPVSDLNGLKNFDVDFIIDEGELSGFPSTVVDLTSGEKILRRSPKSF